MVDTIEAPSPGGGGGGGGGKMLTRQVGPLPAWGWALVLGVAGAIVVVRRRQTASTPTDPGTVTYAQQAQIPTIGNAAGAGGTPLVSGGRPAPTTNDQWRSLAVTTLLAKGYSPLGVDTAMGKYLQGVSLDSNERALIDIALAEIGTPPNPPPPAQSAPTTTTSLPAWITGSNLTKDPNGSVTALDQTYGGATPSDFVPGVTAAHFDVDPMTHAITGAYWIKDGVKMPLPDWAVQAYQAQGVDKLSGVSAAS